MTRRFSKLKPICAGLLASAALFTATPQAAQAQADPYMSLIMFTGANFCPRGWAELDGQLLAINQNQSLFSLLGTNFGGDGRTTFGLPDLRGRAAVSSGNDTAGRFWQLGEKGGNETTTFTTATMAPHNHDVQATDAIADKKGPGLDFLAKVESNAEAIYHDGPANKTMDPGMITSVGGGQALATQSPYITLKGCIATQGLFPPRN